MRMLCSVLSCIFMVRIRILADNLLKLLVYFLLGSMLVWCVSDPYLGHSYIIIPLLFAGIACSSQEMDI